MKIAVVFPGQGSQSLGMRGGFADTPAVERTFREASDILGEDLWALAANGPAEALSRTVVGMTPFVRGDHDLCLGNNGVNFFKGRLDEFRIWKVARSQAQIQAHMNHPLLGTEPNLVAYWPFDEQSPGPTTEDRTGLGNTGVLTNGPVWQKRSDQPLRLYPRLEAFPGLSRQVLISGDAVPGTGFQLLKPTTWRARGGQSSARRQSWRRTN